jgi:hypothetical protein
MPILAFVWLAYNLIQPSYVIAVYRTKHESSIIGISILKSRFRLWFSTRYGSIIEACIPFAYVAAICEAAASKDVCYLDERSGYMPTPVTD